jgi:MerR family redox-sensitive transcriptional activator SoxR
MNSSDSLTIGELASRSGVAPSALRFYEQRGLIASERTEGNQRRYRRAMLRRVAVIQAAKAVGLPLERVAEALERLPEGRTPTARDWERLSRAWRRDLDRRIAELQTLRESLTGCIGCGCLSLQRCALFNPADRASERGPGARYLLDGEPAAEPE